MSATTAVVKITDPVLKIVQMTDDALYQQFNLELSKVAPEYADAVETNINRFDRDITTYRTALQERKTGVNLQKDLEAGKQMVLNQYWDLINACQRIEGVIANVERDLRFIKDNRFLETGTGIDHNYAVQDAFLKARCQKYTEEVTQLCNKVTAQRKIMLQILEKNVATNLSRFCLIVEEKGKPIGGLANSYERLKSGLAAYNVTSIEVPKPDPRKENAYPIGKYPRLSSNDLYKVMGFDPPKDDGLIFRSRSDSGPTQGESKTEAPVRGDAAKKQLQSSIPSNNNTTVGQPVVKADEGPTKTSVPPNDVRAPVVTADASAQQALKGSLNGSTSGKSASPQE